MKGFTNENVLKERKKKVRNIIIFAIVLVAAFVCWFWKDKMIEDSRKTMKDLNSIIVQTDEERTDKLSYLDIKSRPYQFAVYDDTTDSYYMVSDGKYLYIVYMSVSDFNRLNTDDINKNAVRVEGITKYTTQDVQRLAIDAYNEGLEEGEEELKLSDFDDYFGTVYLDMTESAGISVATLPFVLSIVFAILGGAGVIAAVIEFVRFNSSMKKLDDGKLSDIDKEMNSSSSAYYQKAHLYLTEHYIVHLGDTFRVIPYEDVLWMYRFEQRVNGVKSAQSIKILVNDGKTYNLANVSSFSKTSKNAYEEIWETIAKKNDKMALGYTKENIKAMKEKVKEIKKNK